MKRSAAVLALVMVSVLASRSLAATVPSSLLSSIPAGAQVGDSFQLLFVTRDVHDAQSAEIGSYNDFVNMVADNAGIGPATAGVQWFAVASTAAVDARDNAVVQVPVYNKQGELLASGFADMWDGMLSHAVEYDEHAAAVFPYSLVWTGSRSDGTAYLERELGGFPTAEGGFLDRSDAAWIENSNASPLLQLHFYALSEPLLVVPEPSTLAIQACAIVSLLAVRRFRRRQER